jgi:hypothetical protein
MLDQLAFDKPNGLIDDPIEVEPNCFHVGLFCKRPSTPNHITGTATVIDHPFQ